MKLSKPVKIGIGVVAVSAVAFGIYKLVQYLNKPELSSSKVIIRPDVRVATPAPVTPGIIQIGGI